MIPLKELWRAFLGLLRDWPVKAGALAVAGILTLYVEFAQNVTRVQHVRVSVPPIPQGLVLASKIPSFMDVSLYGPAELMDVTASDFKMQLINRRPVRGENVFRVSMTPELPAGLEASYPKEIKVMLDEILYRELPVEVVHDGSLPLGGLKIRPRTVLITGPYAKTADLDRVRTLPVNLKGSGPRSVRAALADLPEFISLAEGQPNDIQVDLWDRQEKDGDYSTVEGIVLRCANNVPGLRLRQPPSVRIRVPIENARPEQFRATAFCPVFLDPQTREIRPAYLVSSLSLEVEDLLRRTERPIAIDGVMIDSLQFEKVENLLPIPVQQGQQEHIFR